MLVHGNLTSRRHGNNISSTVRSLDMAISSGPHRSHPRYKIGHSSKLSSNRRRVDIWIMRNGVLVRTYILWTCAFPPRTITYDQRLLQIKSRHRKFERGMFTRATKIAFRYLLNRKEHPNKTACKPRGLPPKGFLGIQNSLCRISLLCSKPFSFAFHPRIRRRSWKQTRHLDMCAVEENTSSDSVLAEHRRGSRLGGK